jgi:hypothetical protein
MSHVPLALQGFGASDIHVVLAFNPHPVTRYATAVFKIISQMQGKHRFLKNIFSFCHFLQMSA